MNQKHVHKLRRKNYKNGTAVFYCIDNCDYKISVEFALGKETRCNVCENTFRMNEYSIRAAKPRCMNCVKRRTLSSLESLGENNANPLDGIRDIDKVFQTTADSRVESLKDQLQKIITVVKEYNPDDEDDSL